LVENKETTKAFDRRKKKKEKEKASLLEDENFSSINLTPSTH
jgi:hypothetical protein